MPLEDELTLLDERLEEPPEELAPEDELAPCDELLGWFDELLLPVPVEEELENWLVELEEPPSADELDHPSDEDDGHSALDDDNSVELVDDNSFALFEEKLTQFSRPVN